MDYEMNLYFEGLSREQAESIFELISWLTDQAGGKVAGALKEVEDEESSGSPEG